MPVTRQSGQLSHANEPYPRASTSRPKPDPDVIVLSSDNENTCAPKPGPSKRSKNKPVKKSLSVSNDVLEISSSEDASSHRKVSGSKTTPYQRNVQNLKRVNEKLELQLTESRAQLDLSNKRLVDQNKELATQRKDLAAQCDEIDARRREIELTRQKLATFQSNGPASLSIDATKLEDAVSCDVCTHLMQSPYLLVDCGHSYCEGCLKGWFNETRTKHIRTHPTFSMNHIIYPANSLQFFQTFGHLMPVHLRTQLQALYNVSRQQQPEYTCPGCRMEVTGKPVVNYTIKDIVSVVGNALQPDTRCDPPAGTSTARRGKQVTVASPFDVFFPG